MPTSARFVRVALSGPRKRAFTYHLPDASVILRPGQRLLVPFGKRSRIGYFLEETDKPARFATRPITGSLDNGSLFSPELFSLCLWVADYYFANPADCLAAALPSSLKSATISVSDHKDNNNLGITEAPTSVIGYRLADNGNGDTERFLSSRRNSPRRFDSTRTREQLADLGWTDYLIRLAIKSNVLHPVREVTADDIFPFVKAKADVHSLSLTPEQSSVLESLRASINNGFGVHLLHGVTGSGKTLVYCHLARELIERGQTVLFLTPEIHLSGTLLGYLRGFFGDKVAPIHSAMTPRERMESWRGIRAGRYPLVVGPRSAVFAPIKNLGLIIVDEEHDSSYKQDDPSPRFHGRDVAIVRAKNNNVPVLLGSASPSIESYYKATTGQYTLHELKNRPAAMTLPTVRIVDMRVDRLHGDLPFLSHPLKKRTEETLDAGEQVILFLNRRGYSPQIKCQSCGHVPVCPHCDVTLTFHKTSRRLICHYCDYQLSGYERCLGCSSADIKFPGAGTQKVEEVLPRLFKNASAIRFDSDTASGRKRSWEILDAFSSRKHNLLLGTQMVTKGLDLPGVTLVGVLAADLGLDMPDFRASEKTFARLLQVAGRAGRSASPGEVLIQTWYPENRVITDAAKQDYGAFYQREIESRKLHSYPPFVRLVNIILSAPKPELLVDAGKSLREKLQKRAKQSRLSIELLGPAPCPRHLLRRRHRRHLLIKTKSVLKLLRLLADWQASDERFGLPSSVRVVVDVDPDNML